MKDLTVYNLEEVSDMLRIPLDMIFYYVRMGRLAVVRLGRFQLVTAENLKSFLRVKTIQDTLVDLRKNDRREVNVLMISERRESDRRRLDIFHLSSGYEK